VKSSVAAGVSRVEAAVKPGGAVFEAVDSAFNPNEHPVASAVLNNMAKRGEDLVEGAKQELKQVASDYADIAYYSIHPTETGALTKVTEAAKRREEAPLKAVVGAVKGFAGLVKKVGEGLGDVAYYAGHRDEHGANAKIANAVTDIVLDAPQIVLTVEGGARVAKGVAEAIPRRGPTPPKPPPPGGPRQAGPPRSPMKETIEMKPLASKGEALGDPTVPATPGAPVKPGFAVTGQTP